MKHIKFKGKNYFNCKKLDGGGNADIFEIDGEKGYVFKVLRNKKNEKNKKRFSKEIEALKVARKKNLENVTNLVDYDENNSIFKMERYPGNSNDLLVETK